MMTGDIEAERATVGAVPREGRSIVLGLGRQTVEQWVRFAKKASI